MSNSNRTAWLRVASRVMLAAGVAAVGFGVAGALSMLRAGDRDAAVCVREAPPMRITEMPSAAAGRIRRLELQDRIGSVFATIRYAPTSAGATPTIVILGGLGTGRRAVQLVDSDVPCSVASLDYAWSGPQQMSALGLLLRLPDIQRDLMRTAVALRDLMRYLERDPHVERGRLYLVGASLGSPIAAAVAVAERPAGLAILYGFADHAALLEYRLRPHVSSAGLRRWIAGAGAALTANLDAARTLPRLCGTPVLIVCAPDDRDLPSRCSDALWNAACEPRQKIELQGGHIRAERDTRLLNDATAAVRRWLAESERAAH